MYYLVIILSTLIQFFFAGMSFLFIVFSNAGIANHHELSGFQHFIFNMSMILIPLSSVIIASTLLYLSLKKSKKKQLKLAYWWHAFPVVIAVIYCLYIVRFD